MQEWQPIVPSHEITLGDCIVQGFVHGSEFALWRSASGRVQAWENRCIHRSVRLTLGRIIDDRLICGYHGWRYAPGDGQCTHRPAHPGMPVPKGLRIKTYPVVEAAGMVWVALAGELPSGAPAAAEKLSGAGYTLFCRAFVVRCDADEATAALTTHARCTEIGDGAWTGKVGEDDIAVYLLPMKRDRTTLYVWCRNEPGMDATARRRRVSAAFKSVRARMEQS